MSLLNKNTDYAVRALLVVGMSSKQWVSSREISEIQGIPLQFVRRVLQGLVSGGFLISKEGVSGGVALNKQPKDITLKDVTILYQGCIQISDCLFRKQICPQRSTCVLRRRLEEIEQKLVDEFKNITLESLIDDIQKQKD